MNEKNKNKQTLLTFKYTHTIHFFRFIHHSFLSFYDSN
jgi:hypothetical protein